MKKMKVIIGCLSLLLLLSMAVGIFMHRSDRERVRELENQVGELNKQQKKSSVDRRVSKQ